MINNFTKIIDEDLAYIASADLPWRELEGKNILITGANGALPAYMVETILYLNDKLFKQKSTIFALVRNPEKAQKRFERYQNNKHLKFIFQDVCNKIILNESLDYIIHAASQASPKYYGQDPVGTLLPNVLGTYNLLELARQKAVKNFLFFSAGAVYGAVGGNGILTKEENFGPLNPLTTEACYSESKRMGETMCLAWFNQYKVPIKIVRPFHTYGPGIELDDGRVFADFVRNIIHHENITMNSDGSAKRTFCYLADAVIGFFTVLFKGNIGEAYNVAGDKEISILELAQVLVDLFPEKNLEIIYKENKNKGYVKTSAIPYSPDINKIEKLGWKAKYSIRDGFKRMIKCFD
jgi:nucleoside-diphosphate-sugar epimerase